MKKILYYNLILLLVFSLALPAKGDILQSNEMTLPIYEQKEITIQKITTLSVIPSSDIVKLVILHHNSKAAARQECLNFSKQELNFIQGAGPINLNQPASCFQLVPDQVSLVANLQVQPLAMALPQVVVSLPIAFSVAWSRWPLKSTPSALPIAAWVAMTVFYLFFRRRLAKASLVFLQNFSRHLAVYRLQVLRC